LSKEESEYRLSCEAISLSVERSSYSDLKLSGKTLERPKLPRETSCEAVVRRVCWSYQGLQLCQKSLHLQLPELRENYPHPQFTHQEQEGNI
jgi:hypothetical protein